LLLLSFYGYVLSIFKVDTFREELFAMFPLKCITAVGVTGARYARGFGFELTFYGKKLYLGD
jgi:hypothetical protein